MAEETKMIPPLARLPRSRLFTLISGAFRRGVELERLGEIGDVPDAYTESEHHAREIIRHFLEAGLIELEETDDV